MMRLWGKIITDNHIITHDESELINEKDPLILIDRCMSALCRKLDLGEPYWLNKNKNEYKKHRKTVFTQDNFIEKIDFDKFEIEVIEDE